MKYKDYDMFRLEDRVLFEAAAAVEIVEAAEAAQDNPNANVSETDRQAQDSKDALKNAPPDKPAEQAVQEQGKSQADPSEAADVDAQVEQLIQGEIPMTDGDAEMTIPEIRDSSFAVEEAEESGNLVDAVIVPSDTTISSNKELVVINGTVPDQDAILAALKPNQEVLVLEDGNGLAELNEYLDAHEGKYDAIHLVTHGNEGYLSINGKIINAENFDVAEWAAVGEHLADGGDVLLYGCDTAATAEGQFLVNRIAEASGADVAASTDATGISGDWILEYQYGVVDRAEISVENFEHNLTNYTVTNLNDSGTGSLRWAIGQANANVGTDEITFSTNGTIKLETEIGISDSVDIIGNGTDKTILDGQGKTRIFSISDGDNISLTGIALQNAKSSNYGGAVYSSATVNLDISNSTFRSNQTSDTSTGGGALYFANGNLTISDSSFISNTSSGDGGAIYFSGGIGTIKKSTLNNNSASMLGGALYQGGQVTIDQSTINNNSSGGSGGGVYAGATLIVNNSTIHANKSNSSWSGGGIYVARATILVNSTVTMNNGMNGGGNGGGICVYQGGTFYTVNSIITGNIGNSAYYGWIESFEDIYIYSSNASGKGINTIVGPDSVGWASGSSIIDVSYNSLFGTNGLTDKGGPTKIVPFSGTPSTAVGQGYWITEYVADDGTVNGVGYSSTKGGTITMLWGKQTGSAILVSEDQRGYQRANSTSIGAYDPNAQGGETPSLIVTTTRDVVDSTDGYTSLREAMNYAAGLNGSQTISFNITDPDYAHGSADYLVIESALPTISKSLAIKGTNVATGNDVTISVANRGCFTDGTVNESGSEFRIFTIKNGDVTLSHLNLIGGRIDQLTGNERYGAAVFGNGSSCNITIDHVNASGGAARAGGALAFTNINSVKIYDSVFEENRAAWGGAVYLETVSALISDSVFRNNNRIIDSGFSDGYYNGGALCAGANSTFSVSNSTFFNNTGTRGGALYVENSASGSAKNSLFYGNQAVNSSAQNPTGVGGAIWQSQATTLETSTLSIVNCTIAENSAINYAGGVHIKIGSITNSILWGNTASDQAQVVYDASVPITYSAIEGWSAGGSGNIALQSENSGTDAPGRYYANFVDPASGNYRLAANSYLINRGDNSIISAGAVDLAGNSRLQYGYVDIGAYETAGKGNIVIDFTAPETLIYGDSASISASHDGRDGGTIAYESANKDAIIVAGTSITAVKASESSVLSATVAESANWNSASAARTVTTQKRSITVTANNATKVYGETDPELTWQITAGNLVSGDKLSGTLSREPGEAVGQNRYVINQGTLGNPNYQITFVPANFSIQEAGSLVVTTATDVVDMYDGVTSLREALTYAATLGGSPEITFDIVGNDTVILNSALETIDFSLTIDGYNQATGNDVTISVESPGVIQNNAGEWEINPDGSLFRVFSIAAASSESISVALSHLSIIGGNISTEGESRDGYGACIWAVGAGEIKLSLDYVELKQGYAYTGGGIHYCSPGSMEIKNSTFCNNFALFSGGLEIGVQDSIGDMNVLISDTLFHYNYSESPGEAIRVGSCNLTIDRCEFEQMRGTSSVVLLGGTSGNYRITNTLFHDNPGGAIRQRYDTTTVTIQNITIANSDYGILLQGSLTNSILWGGTSESLTLGENVTVTHNAIEGWTGGGVGNISLQSENSGTDAPGRYYANFVDPASGNYRLAANSYLINRGDNSIISAGAVDLAGNSRLQYGYVDIGAYETAGKGNIVIDFTVPETLIYGDSASISASHDGRDGGTIAFNSGNLDAVVLAGTTMTAVKASESSVLSATVAESSNWNSASATGTVTTQKRSITVTANNATKVYGEVDPQLTYQVSGLVGDDTLSGALERAAGEDVGEYAITQGTLANSNYNIHFTGADYTITKRDLTITAGDILGHTYGTAYTLAYTSSTLGIGDRFTGNLVIDPNDANKSRSGNYAVGDHAITIGSLDIIDENGVDMSDNYNIHFNEGTLNIVQAVIEVATVGVADKVYDGTTSATLESWSFNNPVANADALHLSGTASFGTKHAGSGKVASVKDFVLTGADAGNYILQSEVELTTTATIEKATLSIVLDDAAKGYGSADPGFTVKTAVGLQTGDKITGIDRSDKGENVGKYAIDQYAIDDGNGGNNYTVESFTPGTLTISSKVLTIAIDNVEFTYNGAEQFATSYTANGLETGDVITSLTVEGVKDAGIYSIAATDVEIWNNGQEVTGNYTISFLRNTDNVTVKAADVIVNAADSAATYGEDYFLTHDGLLFGDDAFTGELAVIDGSASSSGKLNTGTYTIGQGTLDAGRNYNLIFHTGVLTVNKAELSVGSMNAADRSYDGSEAAEMTGYTFDGLLTGDQVTLTGTGKFADRHAGTDKAVTFGDLAISGADSGNYHLATDHFATTADISRAAIEIRANDAGKGYGSSDPALTYTISSGKLYGADTIDISREAGENVGNYAIDHYEVNDGNGGGNYEVVFTPGNFTIGAKSAVITVGTTTVEYNGDVQNATEYTIEGLESGHSVYQINLSGARNAGTHTVTVESILIHDADGNDVTANYGLSYQAGTLEIQQAEITIHATAETITYGERANAGYTYNGTLYGSDEFTGALSIAGAMNSQNTLYAAGTAHFERGTLGIADGNNGGNYRITFVGADLTVKAKEISLSTVEIQDKVYDGTTDAAVLTAMVAGMEAGDSLSVVTDGASASFVSKNVGTDVEVNADGFVLAGADRNNYILKSDSFKTTADITKANLTIYTQNASKIYGDNDPGFTFSADGLKGGDSITDLGRSNTGANVGSYEIDLYTLNDGNNGNNYNVTLHSGKLTITPKDITVTADNQTKVYGEADPELTYQVSGLVGDDTLAGSLTRVVGEDVGEYAILQGTLANSNYNINFTGATFTITAKEITIAPNDPNFHYAIDSKVYDGNRTVSGAELSVLIDGETVLLNWTDGQFNSKDVLSVSNATFTGLTSANSNYVLSTDRVTVDATGKITAKDITVTADAQTKVYGSADPELTYQVSGLVGNDTLAGSLTRAVGEDVGSYEITQGTLANSNYKINFIGASLTITAKSDVVVKPSGLNFDQYSEAVNPNFSVLHPALTGRGLASVGLFSRLNENVYAMNHSALHAHLELRNGLRGSINNETASGRAVLPIDHSMMTIDAPLKNHSGFLFSRTMVMKPEALANGKEIMIDSSFAELRHMENTSAEKTHSSWHFLPESVKLPRSFFIDDVPADELPDPAYDLRGIRAELPRRADAFKSELDLLLEELVGA